jgi:SAM-dependent methyltransferase
LRIPGFLPSSAGARAYLEGFSHVRGFGLDYYLNTAVDRILATMNLFPVVGPDDRILELAAQPYFMTALMLRHFPAKLEVANEDDFTEGEDGVFKLQHDSWDTPHVFEYEKFNIEFDVFPYPNETYNVVVLCETIEHLAWDPVHTLHEVNRILKPGGYFVVSTPNAFRLENFWKVLRGRNFYPPYSGWGWTARHNREFTTGELDRLFSQNGYRIEAMETHYDSGYDYSPWLKTVALWLDRLGLAANYLDVIHLSAQKIGPPSYSYPSDMFADVHAYPHVWASVVDMDNAPESQLQYGFYKREMWPPAIRWTSSEAMIELCREGQDMVNVRLFSGPPELKRDVVVTLSAAGAQMTSHLEPGEWVTLVLRLPEGIDDALIKLSIEVAETWSPSKLFGESDSRSLGVALQRVWLA